MYPEGLWYDNVRKAWILGNRANPKAIYPDSNTRQGGFLAGVATILPVQVASGTDALATMPCASAVIGDHVIVNPRTAPVRPISWVFVPTPGIVTVAFHGGVAATATQAGIAADWTILRHE